MFGINESIYIMAFSHGILPPFFGTGAFGGSFVPTEAYNEIANIPTTPTKPNGSGIVSDSQKTNNEFNTGLPIDNNTLLLIGVGVVALYVLTRR